MSLRLVRAVVKVENSNEFHLARLLVLLAAADKRKEKTVEGIMKLAKLDFLLRYPNCLERALAAAGKDPSKASIKPHERDTIETQMVRFRYGPWDSRYRRWIGLLMAKGLVATYVKGRTVYVGLTDRGREVADLLRKSVEFQDLSLRSELIIKAVGKYSATKLKDFIYEVFPELLTMKWGEKISI
jgi:hypothetical protein